MCVHLKASAPDASWRPKHIAVGKIGDVTHSVADVPPNGSDVSAGGVTYIYICYGIHQMFNIVTHVKDEPHAVLIRAVEPVSGIALMQQRRQTKELHRLARGPGLVGQAFQLDTRMNGLSLTGNDIWLTREPGFETGTVIKSPRVGMNFEGFYKTVPWRFRISGSQFTSPAR